MTGNAKYTADEHAAQLPVSMQAAIDAMSETISAQRVAQRFKFKKIGRGDVDLKSIKPPSMTLDTMLASLVHVYDKQTYVAFRDAPAIYMPANGMRSMLRHNETTIKNDDDEDEQIPTFDLWAKHEHRYAVHTMTFDPRAGEFCMDVKDQRHALNLWRPRPHSAPADWQHRVQPFFDHVTYLVPNEGERIRFLDWLAHIEQKPWELPHHHYLLFTTVQGIGRNLLAYMLTQVWAGNVALDFDLKQTLSRGFNGQLTQAFLAVVDEIHEGHQGTGWQHAEKLKSMVTTQVRHIDEKYGLQRSEWNCCRWLVFSNFESALPLDEKDRRWNVVRNPDNPKPPEYYAALYKLLDDTLFIESIREHLRQRDISNFNPGARAGMNEAKSAVIAMSLSDEDQKARNLVAQSPRDLIDVSDLYAEIYGVHPVNVPQSQLMSNRRLLRKIAENAGIKRHPSRFSENGDDLWIWVLRNYQHWITQPPHVVLWNLRHGPGQK